MHIEFPDDGGVLLVGDEEELRDLMATIEVAIDHGAAEGQMLTNEGVETVTIRCLEAA